MSEKASRRGWAENMQRGWILTLGCPLSRQSQYRTGRELSYLQWWCKYRTVLEKKQPIWLAFCHMFNAAHQAVEYSVLSVCCGMFVLFCFLDNVIEFSGGLLYPCHFNSTQVCVTFYSLDRLFRITSDVNFKRVVLKLDMVVWKGWKLPEWKLKF